MKKIVLLIAAILVSTTFTQAQETLKINTSKSELKWFGEYTFFFNGHNGTIDFKKGHFIKQDDKIVGGEFIIDMTSIICLDIENTKANNGLVKHLKDTDFFDVEKYSLSKLVITGTQYHDSEHLEVYANLTIKDITLPIKFQATVNYETKQMTTKFKIDRMLWGIEYNSDMRDSAISDAIGFHAKLSL